MKAKVVIKGLEPNSNIDDWYNRRWLSMIVLNKEYDLHYENGDVYFIDETGGKHYGVDELNRDKSIYEFEVIKVEETCS